MEKMDSFVNRVRFRYIIAICLFVVVPEIVNLIKSTIQVPFYPPRYINTWFDFSIALVLILLVATKLKFKEEKIAIISFGIALIARSLHNFIGYQVSVSLVSAFELGGSYFFWLAYKIYKEKSSKPINYQDKTVIVKFLLLLIVLLLPAILFWFLGKSG